MNKKNEINTNKHGVSFENAVKAFSDPERLTLQDSQHSQTEDRFFCISKTDEGILTVRFVIRGASIRIIGAGFWRKGKQLYENR